METLRTVAIDIRESVFRNESEGILYITKDIYSESYIISVPVITFAWEISRNRLDKDCDDLLKVNVFGDKSKRERLVAAIKEGITEFQY